VNRRYDLRIVGLRAVLWALVGVATAVIVARYARGLGATTALSDANPWGLWIGFDVLSGVALAAGGFVLAAAVYIFRLERYHGFVRPAVLTAFLGYVAVALGLAVDLGRPWNIWRPILHWQTDSPLFEVAWCVMLYLTVLALEFAPVVFEGLAWNRAFQLMRRLTLPLVIVGIGLSTLHQSSLGTLFLLTRDRLYPLWDSPLQPLLFFVSAIALGLAMVTVEALVSSWIFRREPEWPQLRGLARAATVVVSIWAVVRLGDLAVRGDLRLATSWAWPTVLFAMEMLLVAGLPIVLYESARRKNVDALVGVGAVSVVAGTVLNRISVGGLAHVPHTGEMYVPAITELAVSVGLVSGMALIFLWCVEHLPVWESPPDRPDHFTRPAVEPATRVYVGGEGLGPIRVGTVAWVVGAVLGVVILETTTHDGASPRATPIGPVRSVAAVRVMSPDTWPARVEPIPEPATAEGAPEGVTAALLLDGDRAGRAVVFDHAGHQRRLGGDASCARCHHRNLPLDRGTSCGVCHRDMYACTDTFGHASHVDRLGGNRSCGRCHADAPDGLSRSAAVDCLECHGLNAGVPGVVRPAVSPEWLHGDPASCLECHRGPGRVRFREPPPAETVRGIAPGYRHVMHRLCITCHRVAEAERGSTDSPVLTRCGGCHPEDAGGQPALAGRGFGELLAADRRDQPEARRGAS
jgi:Ni/Fe-hydrogenase subunit HybB-like protein